MSDALFDLEIFTRRRIPLRAFAAGERIFLEDDAGDAMYVVRSGAVDVISFGNVLDRIREMTGIYGLGFRRESVLGLLVPIAFVILVGGAIAALILLRP